MIGQTISHYKILAKLGAGGMGVVYKALDTTLNRVVALKFLRETLSDNTEEKARFMREARAAAALDHPNIATIYEIAEIEGQIFIAMAYIEGMTLKAQIARHALGKAEGGKGQEAKLALSTAEGSRGLLTEIIDIAIQIAEGLRAAHEKGIVHRDIKSANVMVTPKGQVKITDFGLAKFRDEKTFTQSGAQMGTADYMSPEQIQGETIDHQSDIFSFGVVLYEMLTGQLPFQRENPQATMFAILYNTPRSVNALCPGMPSDLEQIVDRALEREKEDRYQSIVDLADDLQELKRKITTGSEVPLSERKAKKSKQQKSELHLLRKRPESQPVQATERRTKAKMARRKRFFIFGGVAILAVLLIWAGLRWFRGNTQTIDSIAVLPLENFTGDPEQDYFVDGTTEQLISTLSKIGGLRVIARTSVMQYKSASRNVAEIGRELNVGTVLEGSVRQAGNVLRITVQLIDAPSQEHLWSHDYDRQLENVFVIQSDIAQHVAEEMKVRLLAGERQQIEKRPTENVEAYFLYLKGRHEWNKRTEEGFKKSFEYFNQAIEMDPNYALAYAGLADSYSWLGTYYIIPPNEAFPKAKEAAMKAVALDDQLAEAHTSLASILKDYNWSWLEAEREFKRAIELNPSYAWGHMRYGTHLAAIGRPDEAIAEAKRALELDPFSPVINGNLGIILYWTRRYDQAIEQLRKTIAMMPDILPITLILNLNLAYIQKGMFEEAISELEKARARSPNNPDLVAQLAHTYGMAGRRREAQQVLGEFKALLNEEHVLFNFSLPMNLALIYIGLGENDQAFEWLDRAYAERAWLMITLKIAPYFDPLRSDPRFTVLLKKMGLE